jgi:hypothetical protein
MLQFIDKESEDALCEILAQEQEAFEEFLLWEENAIDAHLSNYSEEEFIVYEEY